METDFKSAMKNFHFLDREKRLELSKEILTFNPDIFGEIYPTPWYFRRCEVNVLLVADGGLNFGTTGFGLSEFITAFAQLKLESNVYIDYNVTIAHRSTESFLINSMGIVDPLFNASTFIHDRIENCSFGPVVGKNDVNINSFDQVWLFGINSSSGSLAPSERIVIETYMDNGGGLFATGDHGALGAALCGSLRRVQDMRLWASTSVDPELDEVSMGGARRNDTNRPASGQTVSTDFNNQSDGIPQEIAPRTFSGGLPHPLLSIPTSKRASGVIDIMPDHPHEGECTQEKVFTVNGHSIQTQIIATSFVLAGSTTANGAGKTPTLPHCFPSIHVFDGRPGNVGRIVVDSTWHHFVNINLGGFSNSDFKVIQQYYMNISKWISKPKLMLCRYKFYIIRLFLNAQIVEASLNNPEAKIEEISLKDLRSIGSLAEEIIRDESGAADGSQFVMDMISHVAPLFGDKLNVWKPKDGNTKGEITKEKINLIDYTSLSHLALGAGFIAIRDSGLLKEEPSEKTYDQVLEVFRKGIDHGLSLGLDHFNEGTREFASVLKDRG